MARGGSSDDLDDLTAELDATFLAELAERLPLMGAALAALEAHPSDADRDALLEVFTRHAHSVKGGAMLVGRDQIARLAGALEARFGADREAGGRNAVPAGAGRALEQIARLGRTNPAEAAREASGAGSASAAEVDRLVAWLEGRTT